MGYFSRYLIFILLLMGCGSAESQPPDKIHVVNLTLEVRLYNNEVLLRQDSPCVNPPDFTGCYYQGVIYCMINDEYVCGEELFHALKEVDPSIIFDNPHYNLEAI